jgi:hypothetical protein
MPKWRREISRSYAAMLESGPPNRFGSFAGFGG